MSFLHALVRPARALGIKSLEISLILNSTMATSVPLPDIGRTHDLTENLRRVKTEVQAVCAEKGVDPANVRLVAVSKYKPAEEILALYLEGHRHFGENYVQELVGKAAVLPQDIQWHFIGALQSNKCKDLAGIPNLWAVETLDSIKKARRLNDNRSSDVAQLQVFLQVNTSGEAQKSGVSAEAVSEVAQIAKFVKNECPKLEFRGLMTIGSVEHSYADNEENADFAKLVKLRDQLAEELSCKPSEIELSMGMSADFRQAIRQGSTNVRVGSNIFGARPKKEELK